MTETQIAVHRDWHLASWAQGLAGSGVVDALLGDLRLQPRLMHLAAQGRALPVAADLPADLHAVLAWFAQVPPADVFARLGMLCHAARWGENLVARQGRAVPDWVQADDIKAALTVLQGMADAGQLRSAATPVGPDDLQMQGKGMVAGWWAMLDPALAGSLTYACAPDLSRGLPSPCFPATLCAQAVVALARADAALILPGLLADVLPDVLPDAIHDGGFDD